MRAFAILAILAASLAAPALASDGPGLTLADLVITFDPTSQSSIFSFDLTNNATGPAHGIFADITTVAHMFPQTGIPTGRSLLAGQTSHFDVPLEDRPVANGCIFVFNTAHNETAMQSNEVCATTSGLTQSPIVLPAVPDAPPVPTVPPS